MTGNPIPIDLIQRAFDKLPPMQQQVLLMVRGEGLSYAETGVRLGLSGGEVQRLLARSLVLLDRQLERMNWQERRLW